MPPSVLLVIMNKPRNIYLLILPRVHLLDLAAPGQIFGHDMFADEVNVHYISPQDELCSHQGLSLNHLEALPEQVEEGDWLMLIGSRYPHAYLTGPVYQQAVQWLRDTSHQFGLIAGICSGSLLAAAAGLLKQKQCTTHHDLIDHLRQIEPEADVQEDCIFVADQQLWTSAGITTGLDLCLHLVAEYWGHEQASLLARDMVLYQRRSGNETQLSFWLQHRNHVQSRVHQVQDRVMNEPGRAWTVTELAESVHLGERHLRRLFQQATGHTLQDYLQQARLELAQRLLEQTRLSLDDIAERCGFSAERSLRRSWQRWRGGTPSEYRQSYT
uniref:AraC family transcriptional regulator n=1 Tax=uncultured Thiotrichaceae bacterium TaxID=298394 RepID=A0A6S6U6K0_9GAMM|nr:MAG: AraC family transcriptional regulator [uncultured Thiotrichaceae bacterium]